MEGWKDRRGPKSGGYAGVSDCRRQARRDLAYVATARLGMAGCCCSRTLDESAIDQVTPQPTNHCWSLGAEYGTERRSENHWKAHHQARSETASAQAQAGD